MKEKRKRQGRKERRSQEKKMGGWGGVSRTTVKWLRCYHGDSNEGSQDTLGYVGGGGGDWAGVEEGEGRVMVKRTGGSRN